MHKVTQTSCAIVHNGNLVSEKFLYQVRWLERTAAALGFSVRVIGNQELIPAFEDGRSTLKGTYAGYEPDCFFFWDKDVRLARHLERMGFRLYNRASAIETCDDKIRTCEALIDSGLRLPKTLIAPLVFETSGIVDTRPYDAVIAELGLPLVVKEAFGSFGQQVYLVHSREQLLALEERIQHRPHLFQQFIAASRGRDLRIHVVGDEVAAAMRRESADDFRANVSAGGRMFPHEPTEREQAVAVACAKRVGAEFAGVDLLFSEDGEPYVCEVNSNAHFKNIFDCTGIDLAVRMLGYIREEGAGRHA
jgi:gamma-F420-2:alpha-L-glutamate ligase